LRLLFQNQIEAQNPPFKQQAKQLITRVNTCKVGYVKLLMRRDMTGTPTATAIKTGPEELLASIRAKVMAMSEPDAQKDSGDLAELEMMLSSCRAQQDDAGAAVRWMMKGWCLIFCRRHRSLWIRTVAICAGLSGVSVSVTKC
jgi:hypothetical protein